MARPGGEECVDGSEEPVLVGFFRMPRRPVYESLTQLDAGVLLGADSETGELGAARVAEFMLFDAGADQPHGVGHAGQIRYAAELSRLIRRDAILVERLRRRRRRRARLCRCAGGAREHQPRH